MEIHSILYKVHVQCVCYVLANSKLIYGSLRPPCSGGVNSKSPHLSLKFEFKFEFPNLETTKSMSRHLQISFRQQLIFHPNSATDVASRNASTLPSTSMMCLAFIGLRQILIIPSNYPQSPCLGLCCVDNLRFVPVHACTRPLSPLLTFHDLLILFLTNSNNLWYYLVAGGNENLQIVMGL